jgi:hypothetical protein
MLDGNHVFYSCFEYQGIEHGWMLDVYLEVSPNNVVWQTSGDLDEV